MEKKVLSLADAQAVIAEQARMIDSEHVELHDGLGRVAATSLYALHPLPSFSQSLYDGFVIAYTPAIRQKKVVTFQIVGEIPAGDIANRRLCFGQAYRIMTGARIPEKGWLVVPQELCSVEKDQLMVDAEGLRGKGTFIRKKGSQYRTGTRLVKKGECLTPSDIAILADTGHDDVEVRKRPVVAYCCTGSELVGNSADSGEGLKVSSNRYLLGGLLRVNGAAAQDWGSVDDRRRSFLGRMQRMLKQKPDFIMTTGGMGPGKYDLVEEIFSRMGGEIVFTGVGLRPGKSVLFGVLGKSLFFGLPGPPSAVKALFQVLVRPALLQVQSISAARSQQLVLASDIVLRKSSVHRVLEGMIVGRDGEEQVRLATDLERSSCYILCPPGRRLLKKGVRVRIYRDIPHPWLSYGDMQRF